MRRRWERMLLIVAAVFVVSCLASCQAVFTFSPLSFLQRDPSTLGADQKLAYADQALQSGDDAAMAAAYDALLDAMEADPDNPELQYTAAELALELSGIGEVFTGLLSGIGGDSGGDLLSIDEDVFTSLDTEALGDAGDLFAAAEADGADLTATDYLTVAVAVLLEGASGGDVVDTIDSNENADEAEGYLQDAIDELPEDDASRDMLQALLDSIGGGSGA